MRGLQRRPVRLGLHVPRDRVLQRQREQVEHDDHEQRERHRLRRPHAAAPPRRPARSRNAPGNANSAYQPTSFQMWLRSRWPSSCAITTRSSAVGEPPVEQRVPEHDAPARAETRRLGVRQRRDVVDGLDDDRRVLHVLDALERARLRLQLRVVQTVRVEQVRRDERGQRDEPDEDRRGGQPPPAAGEAGEAPSRSGARGRGTRTGSPSASPVAEGVRDVADVRQVMPALPPEARRSRTAAARSRRARSRSSRAASPCRSARPPTRA